MRISTAQIYGNGLSAMQRSQNDLARTQEQLATGRRIINPSDDPGGAVQVLKLRERIAAVDQYSRNANLATNRLEAKETILAQMGDALQRVRELTVQAANATQTNESRAAIAREVRQLSESLLDAGNIRDASGEYLFAGYRSGSQPFARNTNGAVEYLGDAGQRRIALSPDSSVAVGDSGELLMSITRGNGVYTVTPAPTNVGNGRVTGTQIVDPTTIGRELYTIEFVAEDAWQVLEAGGSVVASGDYAAGQAVDIGGRRVLIAGQPAVGDRFEVAPAGVTTLFAITDDLADVLERPPAAAGDAARRDHAIGTALGDLDQALARVLELRTRVGGRLNKIESQGVSNDDQRLQLQTALSSIEDLDFAEAISRFNLQQVALQAAQQTYIQLGRLSLFDYLR
jgi:flagellar hook-associated protein 3 FlgL